MTRVRGKLEGLQQNKIGGDDDEDDIAYPTNITLDEIEDYHIVIYQRRNGKRKKSKDGEIFNVKG